MTVSSSCSAFPSALSPMPPIVPPSAATNVLVRVDFPTASGSVAYCSWSCSSSFKGSHILANSRVVSASSAFDRRMTVETCRVNFGRLLQRRARTRAEMLLISMPFSDKSTPSHSLPSTTKQYTTFFKKLFNDFSSSLNIAISGFCAFSKMFVKLSAEAYHDVSRKDRFLMRRHTLRGSNSKEAMVKRSRDWHDTTANINCASNASSVSLLYRRSSSKWSMMICLSVLVCCKTRISSRISPALKSQKLRFQTSQPSPQPFNAFTASSKKPSGTCLA
mmetsp:Transcript_46358/g.140659  ORF Transcript_46358/g.140659 Transcript_46358/m.140659 type:complete len:276 (-) Transcript_46358:824-1651(-)